MRAAAAISVHPVPSHATGEVIADILERFEERPDLALVCATPALAGALDDICAAVAEILDPVTLVGVTSSGILGGTTEVESGPGLSLWVATTGPSDARLFSPNTSSTSIADDIVDLISNSGAEEDGSGAVVLLMGDAVDFPATDVVEIVNARAPGAAIAGGLLSGWPGPSGVRLSVDGAVADGGGIAIVLAGVRFDIGVSHGCSPIGESMIALPSMSPKTLSGPSMRIAGWNPLVSSTWASWSVPVLTGAASSTCCPCSGRIGPTVR
jgi:small ligand-binding sensory domain FIST